jgi:hypothetical protein
MEDKSYTLSFKTVSNNPFEMVFNIQSYISPSCRGCLLEETYLTIPKGKQIHNIPIFKGDSSRKRNNKKNNSLLHFKVGEAPVGTVLNVFEINLKPIDDMENVQNKFKPELNKVETVQSTGESSCGNLPINECKKSALEDAKRIAAEKFGVLIESLTRIKNYTIQEDIISSKVKRWMKYEIIDEGWVGTSGYYYVIEATLIPAEILEISNNIEMKVNPQIPPDKPLPYQDNNTASRIGNNKIKSKDLDEVSEYFQINNWKKVIWGSGNSIGLIKFENQNIVKIESSFGRSATWIESRKIEGPGKFRFEAKVKGVDLVQKGHEYFERGKFQVVIVENGRDIERPADDDFLSTDGWVNKSVEIELQQGEKAVFRVGLQRTKGAVLVKDIKVYKIDVN